MFPSHGRIEYLGYSLTHMNIALQAACHEYMFGIRGREQLAQEIAARSVSDAILAVRDDADLLYACKRAVALDLML
jgi:hypothetical protein